MNKVFWKLKRYFQNQVQFGVLDLQKGLWLIGFESKNLNYLKAENCRGRHILIRPLATIEDYFMMVDDVNRIQLEKHHLSPSKKGRLIVETSPENFQVWIRLSRPLSLMEKKNWLIRFRSDPGANPKG